ncbi:uncharacterized protein FOMMEDRAFT_166344 [Fomitiporia mediterranea MF3/22]|uniref:uncharacterized protein n=1 Tax=Fomitiporia mediterranea (strain MF3/22) TaxID=694068 RepID=UPI00044074B5|nr:uncharacterized protein FOMMEDRAFT_166344 [Fomitiporia mediterranea MF3/22]EJD06055.1 hypothetical protein FOMMEDRAFT_166344 [Fomitiporia mediterranea MF3/22]
MSSFKIKVPGRKQQVGPSSEKPELLPPPPTTAPRKKRRVISDDEDDGELSEPPESEEETHEAHEHQEPGPSKQRRRRPSMYQNEAPDPDKLFEDDMDLDIVNTGFSNEDSHPVDTERAPTPTPGLSRKRNKKKSTVLSDEDEDYMDAGRKQSDNEDDDFVVDSPRRKGGRKGGTGGGRGRGKGMKEKGGGIGETQVKDERKVTASSTSGGGEIKAGVKRRRETISELNVDSSSTEVKSTVTVAEQSSTAPADTPAMKQQQEGSTPAQPTSASKVRKLPPIKKNKALGGAAGTSTAPSSGPSTPAGAGTAATAAAKSNITGGTSTPGGLPIHTSLPRKPVQKTADVDLSSPDIYNSLFKSGSSSAPRVGVNSRVKEEERRKELMKMRDDARAVRMVQLQKNQFDLLAGQDKVALFDAKLHERNSPARYPNRLGEVMKICCQKWDAGCTVNRGESGGGRFKRDGNGAMVPTDSIW